MSRYLRQFFDFPASVMILLGGTLLTNIAMFMVTPFLSIVLAKNFGLSPTVIGVVLGGGILLGCLAGFYLGYLSDLIGRHILLLGAVVLYASVFAGLSVVESLYLFIPIAAFVNLGKAIFDPLAKAFMADLLPQAEAKELAFTIRFLGVNLGAALGPWMAVKFGLGVDKSTFIVPALAFFLLLALLAWSFRRLPSKVSLVREEGGNQSGALPATVAQASFRESLAILGRDKAFRIFVLGAALIGVAYSHYFSVLPQILYQLGGQQGMELFSKLLVVNGLTIVFFQMPVSRWTIQRNPWSVVIAGLALMAGGYGVMALADLSMSAVWMVGMFFIALAETMIFVKLDMIVDAIAPAAQRGLYFGAFALMQMGMAVGPVAGGAVYEYAGSEASLVAASVVLLLALVCMSFAYRRLQCRRFVATARITSPI